MGQGKRRKSPQGYDEDNASLDKFCKIKAKKEEKHKKSATNDDIAGWELEGGKTQNGETTTKGGKLHDFRCPSLTLSTVIACGIQQPFPLLLEPLLISPGGIRIIQIVPESRLLVGLFRSSQSAARPG